MNHPRWFSLALEVAPEHLDNASAYLHSLGAQGVQIEDTAILFDQSEDATIVPRDCPLVTGFFAIESPAHLEELRALVNELPGRADDSPGHPNDSPGHPDDSPGRADGSPDRADGSPGRADGSPGRADGSPFRVDAPPFRADARWTEIETQDWATKWRENFPPLAIGPFLVVPTWEEVPPNMGEQIVLRLDPGLAFGTGQHPTTHLCLELLAQELAQKSDVSLLDVGCGSGILSLAAAKLGARVVASDLDLWCVEATQENAELNGVSDRIEAKLVADLGWVKSPFPLVVANLMSALLIRLAPDLARATRKGGTLIVSGISSPRADDVQSALERAGFTVKEKRERDGETRGDGWIERWSAFVFEKRLEARG